MTSRPDIAEHPARVLIVDDERHNREVLRLMLEPEGYLLFTAASGEEALEMIAAAPPDLILLDVMMPGMDGYAVAARIKDNPLTTNTPVIMVTALNDHQARMRGLNAGAEDFLTKPLDRIELCARVRNLLRLKAYGDYHDKSSQMLEGEVKSRMADLRRERDRAQRYLDVATVMLIALDLQGRVTLANGFACAILGWTEEELLGRDWFSTCLAPAVQEVVKQKFHTLLREELSVTVNTILTRAGQERLIEWHSTTVRDDDGQLMGTFSSGTDVTASKTAEAELRAAKEAAEAANQAKNEFLANVSHEIRTPMNGVIGMTNLVLDTDLTFEQRENLRTVKSSADSLLTVINDILDFSRMEAGKLELDPIDFNTRDAIGDTANALALRAQQKGLELIVDIEAAVPQVLTGDVGRLRQILVNLLGNAIKFTPAGEVVLRVASEPAAGAGEVALHFSVSDTGVGIPLDRQKSVFEAFTQVDGSTTRTYGGTGLGLTISSQLVRLMGGRLWVESAAGSGSTFHFTANFIAVETPVLTPAVAAIYLRQLPALVVDDNATNRRLLEEMLKGWQMVPTLVSSAPAALAALRAATASGRPFLLVLVDGQMPGMDGFGLAGAIKKDKALAGAPIVMLTSAGQPGDAARCRQLGIAAYLTKPVRRSELHGAILLALGAVPPEEDRPPVTRHSVREAALTGRILLVESDGVSQLVARRLLEKRGHTVVVTSNAQDALALLDHPGSPGFGCVLMEVDMPIMDGLECAALIRGREQAAGFRLPIIGMTADAMKSDEARFVAAGMDGCLPKPIQPAALFQAVERSLLAPTVAEPLS